MVASAGSRTRYTLGGHPPVLHRTGVKPDSISACEVVRLHRGCERTRTSSVKDYGFTGRWATTAHHTRVFRLPGERRNVSVATTEVAPSTDLRFTRAPIAEVLAFVLRLGVITSSASTR